MLNSSILGSASISGTTVLPGRTIVDTSLYAAGCEVNKDRMDDSKVNPAFVKGLISKVPLLLGNTNQKSQRLRVSASGKMSMYWFNHPTKL